tara:strand:- start:2644 stop:3228 length:585 start_codon:yes stop_codon:yes gene_type:complete
MFDSIVNFISDSFSSEGGGFLSALLPSKAGIVNFIDDLYRGPAYANPPSSIGRNYNWAAQAADYILGAPGGPMASSLTQDLFGKNINELISSGIKGYTGATAAGKQSAPQGFASPNLSLSVPAIRTDKTQAQSAPGYRDPRIKDILSGRGRQYKGSQINRVGESAVAMATVRRGQPTIRMSGARVGVRPTTRTS